MKMENFKDKIVVITGASHGIGLCTAGEFVRAGAKVVAIDVNPMPEVKAVNGEFSGADGEQIDSAIDFYKGDISDKRVIEKFVDYVVKKYGHIDCLINNALPAMVGIDECSYEEFTNALAVGVAAPFYLSKLFAPYFAEEASIVNMSSSRDRMSMPQTESYTAAKGGIAALTHALAVSFAGKVRVNSISPGWIETNGTVYEGPDAYQQPAGRVGEPIDIANMILFLCSDKAGFITGENITIDGGMTKLMVYHAEHGWSLQ